MADIPSTPADGNVKTVLVPAVAVMTAPTVTETTAATAKDISCYLTPGGFALTVDQATVTDERECDTTTRNAPGRKTPTLGITGIDNTNSENADDANDLADALVEGSVWYAIRRRGVAFDQPLAADDKVTVTKFTVGARSEVAVEANSVLRSTWAAFVGLYEQDAVIVASGGGD